MKYFVYSTDGFDGHGFNEYDTLEAAVKAMDEDAEDGYRFILVQGLEITKSGEPV